MSAGAHCGAEADGGAGVSCGTEGIPQHSMSHVVGAIAFSCSSSLRGRPVGPLRCGAFVPRAHGRSCSSINDALAFASMGGLDEGSGGGSRSSVTEMTLVFDEVSECS